MGYLKRNYTEFSFTQHSEKIAFDEYKFLLVWFFLNRLRFSDIGKILQMTTQFSALVLGNSESTWLL